MTAWISHNLSRKEHGWRYTSSPNNTRPISSLALRVPTDGRVRLQSALLSVSVSLSLVESSSVPETTSHAMAPHPEIEWFSWAGPAHENHSISNNHEASDVKVPDIFLNIKTCETLRRNRHKSGRRYSARPRCRWEQSCELVLEVFAELL